MQGHMKISTDLQAKRIPNTRPKGMPGTETDWLTSAKMALSMGKNSNAMRSDPHGG